MSAMVTDVAKAAAATRDVAKSVAVHGSGRDAAPAAWSVRDAAAVVLDVARTPRPDVLLVRPWAKSAVPEDALVDDALGVGYLASALRAAGFEVAVLDAFTFGFTDAQVVACVLEIAARVVGISLHSFADYEATIAIAGGVRSARPDLRIVLGGEHATFLARPLLEWHPGVDAIVVAEGEQTLVDLARAWVAGNDPGRVPGAMTRDAAGGIVDGGTRPAIADLDAVPDPAKDVVEIAARIGRPVAVSVLSGRGCTHRCTFCTAHTYLRLGGGAVWRRREAKAVACELEAVVERFMGRAGVDPMIQFQDVVFLGTSRAARAWTRDFVAELERRGLRVPFYVMARAEAVVANADLLPRLACAGLASIEIGIESGVDRILDAYGKQASAAEALRAVVILRDLGIAWDASGFIMFDPRMTLDDVRTNVDFLEELDHLTWDRAITRLQVFPGTVIRSQLQDEGLLVASRGPGDVYDYRFLDPRVGALASRVCDDDPSTRRLDALIRANRRGRGGGGAGPFGRVAVAARRLYAAFLRDAIALAEDAAPDSELEARREAFLREARRLAASDQASAFLNRRLVTS